MGSSCKERGAFVNGSCMMREMVALKEVVEIYLYGALAALRGFFVFERSGHVLREDAKAVQPRLLPLI